MYLYKIIAQNVPQRSIARDERRALTIHIPTSEMAPFCKTGGLGEMTEGLVNALGRAGHTVKVYLPNHSEMLDNQLGRITSPNCIPSMLDHTPPPIFSKSFPSKIQRFNNLQNPASSLYDKLANINFTVIDSLERDFFNNRRPGNLYGYDDNHVRYGYFNAVVASLIEPRKNSIIHAQDWETGHVSTLMRTRFAYKKIPLLYTIHNLPYTFATNRHNFYQMTGLTEEAYPGLYGISGVNRPNTDEADPSWSAINHSDFVNTVSKQYVKDTLSEAQGEGFQGLLQKRYEEGTYSGIPNGVDFSWYPPFNAKNFITEKPVYKSELQRKFGLQQDPEALLIMMAVRFDNQKGYDLVIPTLKRLATEKINFQFVVTAQGDPRIHNALTSLANDPELQSRIGIVSPYDKELTLLAYRGADVSLSPSKIEPCGLVAPTSMMNGTIPIVRKVGGHIDTVKHGENGFLFEGDWYRAEKDSNYQKLVNGLHSNIMNVFNLRKEIPKYHDFIANMMKQDLSWDARAKEYIELYYHMLDSFKINGHYKTYKG